MTGLFDSLRFTFDFMIVVHSQRRVYLDFLDSSMHYFMFLCNTYPRKVIFVRIPPVYHMKSSSGKLLGFASVTETSG